VTSSNLPCQMNRPASGETVLTITKSEYPLKHHIESFHTQLLIICFVTHNVSTKSLVKVARKLKLIKYTTKTTKQVRSRFTPNNIIQHYEQHHREVLFNSFRLSGHNSAVSSLPKTAGWKDKRRIYTGFKSHSEVKCSQMPAENCWSFKIIQYRELWIVPILTGICEYFTSEWD